MNLIEYLDKRFMAKFDRYEPAVMDSTAAGYRDTCDRKYFYRIVLGRTVKIHENQTVFDFGTAYHKFKELLRKTGDFDSALREAVKLPIYSPSPKPKFSYLTKGFLMKSAMVAYEQWEKEQAQGKIKLIPNSVEQAIVVQLRDGSYSGGRVDAMVEWAGNVYDEDDKTSSSEPDHFEASKSIDDQTTRYIHNLGLLRQARIGGVFFNTLFHKQEGKKDDKKDKIEVRRIGPIERTPAQLETWENEQIHKNELLQINRKSDIWPMREGYQCNFCEYRWVCRQTTEKAQMAKLENEFILKPWNFMKTEQEEI